MSYKKKTWQNRDSEHPYRRTLTDTTSGTSQTVDVIRAEGEITTEGDAFDANTMNNMEGRIADEFSLLNQKVGDLTQLETEAKKSLVEAINEVADAIDGKADIASPAFTGTPTAPTPSAGDDSTKIATTAFVQDEKPSVGSITNLTTVSTNTSDWQNVGSVDTTKGSKYLIIIAAEFAGNSTGVRRIGISTTSGGAPMDFFQTVGANNMGTVEQQLQLVGILAPSSNTTYYINVAQNSGSGLEIKSKYSLIKLA